jgi:hypothetical protein
MPNAKKTLKIYQNSVYVLIFVCIKGSAVTFLATNYRCRVLLKFSFSAYNTWEISLDSFPSYNFFGVFRTADVILTFASEFHLAPTFLQSL